MILLVGAALALQTAPAPAPPPPSRASLASKVVPLNSPQTWVTNDDYPAEAWRDGLQGMVSFSLEIDTQGMVSTCEITASSGSPVLDIATCNLLTARARFRPATDETGKPIYARWPSRFSWKLPAPVITPLKSWVQVVHFELDAADGIAKCEERRLGTVPESFKACLTPPFPPQAVPMLREHSGGATEFDMVTIHQVAGTPMPGGFKLPNGTTVFDSEVLMTIGADGKMRGCEPVRGATRMAGGSSSGFCDSMFRYAADPGAGDKRQVTWRTALIARPPAKP